MKCINSLYDPSKSPWTLFTVISYAKYTFPYETTTLNICNDYLKSLLFLCKALFFDLLSYKLAKARWMISIFSRHVALVLFDKLCNSTCKTFMNNYFPSIIINFILCFVLVTSTNNNLHFKLPLDNRFL